MEKIENWSAAKIKSELILAGVSQSEIARECEVSPTQVYRVLRGAVSEHIRFRVARAIRRDVKDIWPEYYLKKQVM